MFKGTGSHKTLANINHASFNADIDDGEVDLTCGNYSQSNDENQPQNLSVDIEQRSDMSSFVAKFLSGNSRSKLDIKPSDITPDVASGVEALIKEVLFAYALQLCTYFLIIIDRSPLFTNDISCLLTNHRNLVGSGNFRLSRKSLPS